jgi:hypothetical protein
VSIERIFHCDWKECDGHVRTARLRPSNSFITVSEHAQRPALHFCSWDCVLRYAAEREPLEEIPWAAET